jgi:transposase InsO family protein
VPLATAPAKSLEDRAAQALTASPVAAPRNRGAPTTNDLAAQIALVDTARAALASGAATRALASVRDYQSDYPNGAFRPEVAAIKIEALMKLARRSEARALAERFRASYGPGPLADRVSRLVGAPQP